MAQLQQVEEAIKELIARRAVHAKKNVCIADENARSICGHLREELNELRDGMGLTLGYVYDNDNVLEELGDILGIVVHLMIRNGCDSDELIEQCLSKLAQRYPK